MAVESQALSGNLEPLPFLPLPLGLQALLPLTAFPLPVWTGPGEEDQRGRSLAARGWERAGDSKVKIPNRLKTQTTLHGGWVLSTAADTSCLPLLRSFSKAGMA